MRSLSSIPQLLFATAAEAYLAPNSPGKYNVTLTTGPLTDYNRNDPYSATPTPRRLMLSIFQPTLCASIEPVAYMPEKTAKYQGAFLEKTFNITHDFSPLFLEARLPVCPSQHHSCSFLDDGPVLLFSPGYSIPRLYYNVLASAIASKGFTVITIDHPEDANIIIYPDGHAVYNNASILDQRNWDEYPRATDASFIIDQLSNATAMAELLPQRGSRPFPIDRVAMLGHSIGGASSVVAANQDSRIRGVINWDGTLIGNPPLTGLSPPVLFMTHDSMLDSTWGTAWPQFYGPKLIVRVLNTTHETFSDVPTLIKAAGESLKPYEDLLGTIEPAEMVRILTTYTAAWMNGAFAGNENATLLEEELPREFPGVSIQKRGNF